VELRNYITLGICNVLLAFLSVNFMIFFTIVSPQLVRYVYLFNLSAKDQTLKTFLSQYASFAHNHTLICSRSHIFTFTHARACIYTHFNFYFYFFFLLLLLYHFTLSYFIFIFFLSAIVYVFNVY